MPPPNFPRLLFLTPCAFNHVTGGGVTFSNLFRGWPPDRLAVVTDDPVPVCHDVCRQYYFLTDEELRYVAPFRWLRRRTTWPQSLTPAATPARNERRFMSLAQRSMKTLVGSAGIPDCGRLSASLRAWLTDYRPELVYTILGTPGYCDLLEAICRELHVPFVLHIMDNGTVDPLRTGLFAGQLRRSFSRRMHELVPRAAQCLAIGTAMAEEYRRMYGRPFLHFQNAIDLNRWQSFVKRDLTCSRPARLVYIGSILPYAVLHSLQDCCRAVVELHRQGLEVQLEIYTPLELFGQHARALQIDPSIHVHQVPANDEGFFALLQQADALLLPVNFDAASVHFIRLSMPTKVPSYLASGVPVLVYGPSTVAQVAYAQQHQWGHVVDRQSADALQRALRAILTDAALRSRLSQQAQKTAREHHDAEVVRAHFQSALIEAHAYGHTQSNVPRAA